jgi:hypothetical protein
MNYAERFILMQALIVRRVPSHTRITPELLLKALRADNELVRQRTPDLYFQDDIGDIQREVDICLEEGLIEDSLGRKIDRTKFAVSLRRTPLGECFLGSLGSDLEEALDSMPMSDIGVLDFLSLL